MELLEIPKHLYDILISDTMLSLARFGYKNPSTFQWEDHEPSPYEVWEAIQSLRKISLETGDEI